MKILIASDIHGSALYCSQLLDAAKREEAEIIENQWKISGEELDSVIRDIQRLEKKRLE